jgi:hypothetical protein
VGTKISIFTVFYSKVSRLHGNMPIFLWCLFSFGTIVQIKADRDICDDAGAPSWQNCSEVIAG